MSVLWPLNTNSTQNGRFLHVSGSIHPESSLQHDVFTYRSQDYDVL